MSGSVRVGKIGPKCSENIQKGLLTKSELYYKKAEDMKNKKLINKTKTGEHDRREQAGDMDKHRRGREQGHEETR